MDMKLSRKHCRQPSTRVSMVMLGNGAFSLKNRLYPIVAILSFFLFFYGCGETSNRQSSGSGSMTAGGEFSTALPKPLQKHRVGLSAEVQIVKDDGTVDRTEPLFIDTDTHQLSGRVDGLLTGAYTFTIRYSLNGVLVATETSQGVVSENATASVGFASLTFLDDDGDGFTNLAELQFGTNHQLASSKPPAEIFRFSSSYAMTDIAGISPLGGQPS